MKYEGLVYTAAAVLCAGCLITPADGQARRHGFNLSINNGESCADLKVTSTGEIAQVNESFTLSKGEAPILELNMADRGNVRVRGWDHADYSVETCKVAVAETRAAADQAARGISVSHTAKVFVTGATGFMGQRLCAALVERGHGVRGLARAGSEQRLVAGVEAVPGDPLVGASYRDAVAGCDTMVHLVGVAHPSPSKAAQFRSIDLASARQAISTAVAARVPYFLYVSVAHPAPIMKEYIAARIEAEGAIRAAGLSATILRPWYVLGPGRRWPLVLAPVYRLMEAIPATRAGARRLGLLNAEQMIAAMVRSVERPAPGVRVLEVPDIRKAIM
jgi:uncharacterized protein YbjT (DUF2867 family)